MASFLARSDAQLRRSRISAPAAAFALVLALAVSSGCRGWVPDLSSGNDSSGGGASDGTLTVSPLGDTEIGPHSDFDPARLRPTYVLANASQEPMAWEVRTSKAWLTPSASGGILAAGESVDVPVEVDPHLASQDDEDPAVASVVFLQGGTEVVLATCTVTVLSSFERFGSGWTTLAPSADSLVIFVSDSRGDDANDGLSPASAKRTIAAGEALLRHGFPDWLLLRRGDAWHESLGQWRKGGRGPHEPMVVSAYGDAMERPLLLTGTQGGIRTNGGGGTPASLDDLALVGLHFRPDGYTGGGDCVGAQMLQPGARFLIEDCMFEGYSTNLVFQGYGGRHRDFRLRRSVIVDAYNDHSSSDHSQGLYAFGVDGLLIEENLFDHNGWSAHVPGAGADIYSHNLYIDNGNTGVRVRGNLIANGSSHGLQLRCGGSVVNNLFVRNSIALLVGGGNNPEPGGVRAEVHGNVILDGKDIDASNPRGWGVVLSNLAAGNITYNVIAGNELGLQPAAMILDGDALGDTGPSAGIHDTDIIGNIIYNWGGGVLVEGELGQIDNVVFAENDLQNSVHPEPLLRHFMADTTAAFRSGSNRFFNPVVPTQAWTQIEQVPHSVAYWKAKVGDTTSVIEQADYGEPRRSLAEYSVVIGGSFGLEAFLAQARLQSRTNWRQDYKATRANRYIRAGF